MKSKIGKLTHHKARLTITIDPDVKRQLLALADFRGQTSCMVITRAVKREFKEEFAK
jgi:predicted transcriptional regulator